MRDDKVWRLATLMLVLGVASGFASTASAQTIPDGQSCGGLLCDLGVFGHKTGPVEPAAPPAAAQPAAVAPRVAAPAEHVEATSERHRRKHMVAPRVATAPSTKRNAAALQAAGMPKDETPAPQKPPASAAPIATLAPLANGPLGTMVPGMSQALPARAPAPVYQRPLIFQSIDPILQ